MIILIDNHDSFTYNLVQYFLQIDPAVCVFQDGEISATELDKLAPHLVVLSPGPGRPRHSEILQQLSGCIPILGVCLGHQTIIEHFGGSVIKGCQPVHGKLSLVSHDQAGVFERIPNPTSVVRYHSLVADEETMPAALIVTARAEDGAIMAVRHKTFPITGIQFHPESILTADGFAMLQNVYDQAVEWKKKSFGGKTDGQPLPAT